MTRVVGHKMKLVIHADDDPIRFSGQCECGWTTRPLTTAGSVHGLHGTHVDAQMRDRPPDRQES